MESACDLNAHTMTNAASKASTEDEVTKFYSVKAIIGEGNEPPGIWYIFY